MNPDSRSHLKQSVQLTANKLSLIIACWLFSTLIATAQDSLYQISGTVFLDHNQNGVQDRREKGLHNIPVSNGTDITYTDKRGNYQLQVRSGMSVFPILPSGYAVSSNQKIKNAAFTYLSPNAEHKSQEPIHFALYREPQSNNFRIGAIGDIQVGDDAELGYAAKSIISELANRHDIQFHLILGDLVNDEVHLFPHMTALLNEVPAPSWTVLGNHDRNTANPANMADAFNEAFGSSTYAFNYGDVHFIVLNNVFSTGKFGYEGRVDTEQLTFLANNLERLPKDQLIVLSQHIPMAHTRNRDTVLKLLKDFKQVLILSGHTHQVSRHFYEWDNIHEVVTGAPSGTWWRGEKDREGIPEALMHCGSPRNYFTIDFRKNQYSLNFKGIGLDAKEQLSLSLEGDTLFANIFAGSDSTIVQVSINHDEWFTMEKADITAPQVSRLVDLNREKVYPTAISTVNPLRKRRSPHMWQVKLPQIPTAGVHTIRIRAHDQYGFEIESTKSIFIQQAL